MIRRLGQFALVGILSGMALLGIGGRVAMRGLALAVGRPTNFGLGASAGIVLIGSVIGLVGGILFALVGGRLPSSAAAKGALFGTLYFALLIPLQPAAVHEEIDAFRGHLWLATICFWLIVAGYGVTLSEVVARGMLDNDVIRRRVVKRDGEQQVLEEVTRYDMTKVPYCHRRDTFNEA